MRVIAVVEEKEGPLAAALTNSVGNLAHVVRPQQQPGEYDIVVWAQNPSPRQSLSLRAKALAVCGENAADALAHCTCGVVVTYGFSLRDTLTPSATLGEGQVLSLQRGIVTLDGAAVEPMEIPVNRLSGEMETRMAVAAVRLLLGADENNDKSAANISFS